MPVAPEHAARLADGGPRYVETPADAPAGGVLLSGGIAEPYNAASALLFVAVVGFYAGRLGRRALARVSPHRFLAGCLPILLVGGVGGALYHATRASKLFFLLDVVPIFILSAAVSVRLWLRVFRGYGILAGLLLALGVLQFLVFATMAPHAAVNASYVMLAVAVVAPLAINVVRDRGQGAAWVIAALVSFSGALFFRVADTWGPHPLFPMGTHWLWHLFGALATIGVAEYVYGLAERPEGRSTAVAEDVKAAA